MAVFGSQYPPGPPPGPPPPGPPGNPPPAPKFPRFHHFHFWCQKVLPLVYDDSLSYYETLCKLVDLLNELISNENEMATLLEKLETDINSLQQEWDNWDDNVNQKIDDFIQQATDDYEHFMQDASQRMDEFEGTLARRQDDFEEIVKDELQEMANILEDIRQGKYIDLYLDSIKAYIDENLQNFVADLVKYVCFGLSADGHFVAYIPKSWEFIKFSTINDPDSELYNHLVLSW